MERKHRIAACICIAFLFVIAGIFAAETVFAPANANGAYQNGEIEKTASGNGITIGVPEGFEVNADMETWDISVFSGGEWNGRAAQAAVYVFDEGEAFSGQTIDPSEFGIDDLGLAIITYVVELDASKIDKVSAGGYDYFKVEMLVNNVFSHVYYTWVENRIVAVMMIGDQFHGSPASKAVLESVSYDAEKFE